MEVVIKNGKPKRASFSIEVEDLLGTTPLDKRCYFLKIPEGKSQRTSYRHTFARRGLYVLSGYRIATKFPFALFRKSRDVDAPLEVLVYPARVAVPRPPPRAHVRGDATANRLGRRGEFFGLRERRTGDDRRDVHWKSSARTGRLLVREYEDELARRVAIAVDNALPQDVRDAVDRRRARAGRRGAGQRGRARDQRRRIARDDLPRGRLDRRARRARRAACRPASAACTRPRILRALALLPYAADDRGVRADRRRASRACSSRRRGVMAANRPHTLAR